MKKPRRVILYDCTCDQCGKNWTTEKPPPRCPKCFSRTWDRPALIDYKKKVLSTP